MGRLVTKDAYADGAQQRRSGSIAKRLVERNGQYFGCNQHCGARLQAGQLPQAPKYFVQPVIGQPGNPLTVQESPQDAAVLLLLLDEEAQSGYKPGVRGEPWMRGGPAHETPAARPFAKLELLNGPGDRT